ncbi:Aminoglycoside/hydroxyurea antibiotic resistance kinase [Paenibacillus sp. yr247]|uniref:aminoglycoside phosphotransferase family protein n=1 Tax=Paenibacillus sp. yr247 TaxID=1761880 RepID=UPI0008903DE9|nr:aminoglycoside phosphotransferase family protein [Paenibacillus sp. yr247]SDM77957.1 Aminoglycoside/hydroxyurea antibiotic resistance kinase [Paenibacillus sp. yr247]
MNKRYSFKQNEIENIINHFGKDFYEKVLKDIEVYADIWTLTSFQLIPSYSAKLVFKCFSKNFGSVVLKIGKSSSEEIVTEFNTLFQYNGRRFCRVFDADIENGVILEECVQPGNPLRNESSLDKRLSVFCSLFEGLHIPPARAEIYPTYTEWVDRITEYMSKRQDCKELYLHMKKAKEICLSVSTLYSQKMLLHGDFHHDNILLGNDGEYIIIDPKGVIGDPVFDVPRFILNEFGDEITTELYKKINDIICILEKNFNIPNDILKKCLYVETAMGICWMVEDGSTPEEFPNLIKIVAFAETILNT